MILLKELKKQVWCLALWVGAKHMHEQVSLVDIKQLSLLYSSKPVSSPLALKLSVVPSALSAGSPSGSSGGSPRGSSSPIVGKQETAAFVTNGKSAVFVVSDKLRYEFQLTEAKNSASKTEPSALNSFLLGKPGYPIATSERLDVDVRAKWSDLSVFHS